MATECLAALPQAFANDQWIGEHYSDEQAVEAVMDRFKKLGGEGGACIRHVPLSKLNVLKHEKPLV